MKNQKDFYSASGAESLKRTIVKYWRDRGFHGIDAERYQDPNFPGSWFIRSNIAGDGFPPRRAA